MVIWLWSLMEGSALGTVIGILRKTVASFSLDDLLQDAETELGAHLTIRSQVEREAREKLRQQGIELQADASAVSGLNGHLDLLK